LKLTHLEQLLIFPKNETFFGICGNPKVAPDVVISTQDRFFSIVLDLLKT
jgi:hypothetical protein